MKFKFFHDSWFWAILENERIIKLFKVQLHYYSNVASWELLTFSAKERPYSISFPGLKKAWIPACPLGKQVTH